MSSRKVKISYPTTLAEMSLKEFGQISEVLTDEHQPIDIAKLYIDSDVISQVPEAQVNQIYLDVVAAINEQGRFEESFELNGQVYIFDIDLKNAPVGMIADINTFEQQGYFENLHNILAILYREGEKKLFGKYKMKPYLSLGNRPEIFKEHLKADIAASALVFFLSLLNSLERTLSDFTKK